MISIPYTVNDFLYYSQGIPNAYNRVRRICPKGTADSPCKVMVMCCCTSLLSFMNADYARLHGVVVRDPALGIPSIMTREEVIP